MSNKGFSESCVLLRCHNYKIVEIERCDYCLMVNTHSGFYMMCSYFFKAYRSLRYAPRCLASMAGIYRCLVAIVSLVPLSIFAQPYGLTQRQFAGPFLSNSLPKMAQSASAWQAVPAFPNITFNDPTFLVAEPRANRLYVGGRQGDIYLFVNNSATTNKTLFLDLTSQTQGNQDCGLVGMAFHPEYGLVGSTNRGYVYIYYQYSPEPVINPTATTMGYNRLSRFTVQDGNLSADPASELILINQFDRHAWHGGGGMFFGPDGYLYLSNGDEGALYDTFNQTQEIDSGLFSGVLRIDVDMIPSRSHPIRRQPQIDEGPPSRWPPTYSQHYYIPNDNPWLDVGGSVLEEFYAIGFRSPHRMTYDPLTARIWLGDVGNTSVEEVDIVEKGGNYQWAYMEGTMAGVKAKPNPLIGVNKPPIHDYLHNSGNNCVIGGYVYRGAEHAAFLSGMYIFGDNGSCRIWAMTYDGGATASQITELCVVPNGGTEYTGLSSFGVDNDGEIYMCIMGTGTKIHKLIVGGSQGNQPPPVLSQTGAFTNLATLSPNPSLIPYTVNSPLWSDNAVKSRWMSVPNDGAPYAVSETIGFSTNGAWMYPLGTVFIKHFELPIDDTNPSVRKRLETRFLVHGTNGSYYGLTYKWRSDNSDADLLTGSLNETNLITTTTGIRTQVWYYPSRQDCLTCHNVNADQVLGPKTCQMNGDYTYPATGVNDNQIRALNHIGLFGTTNNEVGIPSYPKSVSVSDTNATLAHRVRSYLDANCSHCHRPNGVQAAFFDARFDTPILQQGLINGSVANPLGISGAHVVTPQSPSQSILHMRDSILGNNQMPPLAKNVVDTNYISVLTQWINELLPVAQPITNTIGNPNDGASTDSIGDNIINAIRRQATNDMTVDSMFAKVVGITGSYKCAIYTDNGGVPGVLLRSSAELIGAGTGWKIFPLTGTQTLTNGQYYWLAIWANDAAAAVYYSSGSVSFRFGNQTYGSWPSPLTLETVGLPLNYSIYAAGLVAPTAENMVVTIPEDVGKNMIFSGGGGTIGYGILSNPTNGVLSGFNPNNGAVTYTPNTNYNGTDMFRFTTSNGSDQATGTVSLTITAVNDAPAAMDENYDLGGGAILNIPSLGVLTNDSDVEGDSLSAVLMSGPLQGALNLNADGGFSYTPTNHYNGVDEFTYQASDGLTNSGVARVSISVSNNIQITSISVSNEVVMVEWAAIAGKSYRLQYKDELTDTNWTDLMPDMSATGSIAVGTNEVSAVNRRFYRVFCPGN